MIRFRSFLLALAVLGEVTGLSLSAISGHLPAVAEEATPKAALPTLTEAQGQQILAIRSQGNDRFVEYTTQLIQAEQAMNALMNSATASEEQVRAKYAEVESWRKKIVDNEFETRLAIRRVLPPELRLPFAIKLQENIDRAERTFERQRKSP